MARTNNTILNIERVRINENGKIVLAGAGKQMNAGVKISFKTKEGDSRTLYYFSSDLVDDALARNPGMVKFLDNLPSVTTYIKSASYLLHYANFSKIRNAILGKSNHILQDDSGIAYHYYEKDKWDIQLYGTYVKPISQFKLRMQEDLKSAYRKDSSKVKAIPFIIGYHWGSKEPNLQLSSRKSK
jgi:predicted heme/steroid binding protein